MSGSSNKSDIAEKRKLEAQLYEAKESLSDTYYERSRDQQSQALDDEAEAFGKAKEKYVEYWREYSKDTNTVLNDMFLNGIFNADVANEFLLGIKEKYGIPLSTELTTPWATAAETATGLKEKVGVPVDNTVTMISDSIIDKLGTDDENNPWNKAVNMASKYANFLTSSEFSINNNDMATFEGQINSIVKGWNDVKTAADNAYNAQNRKVTVGGNPNVDGKIPTDYRKGDGNPPDGNKQKTLSKETKVDMIPHYLDSAGNIYYKVQGMTDAYVSKASTTNKSGSLYAPKGSLYYGLAEKNLKKKQYGGNTSVGGGGKLSYVSMYAKGTMGTSNDQWAITDEPWLGDELTMYATPDGKLSYMRAGSTVIPADITANLVEWGKLNPDMMKIGGGANINMISNAVNKPELNFEFDRLVHVDHCSQDTLKDLEKMVDNKINQFTKRLNYSLKGIGAK